MELEQLQALVPNYDELKNAIISEKKYLFGEINWEELHEECRTQYHIKDHKIFNHGYRPDKLINKSPTETISVPVTRIPVSMQKKIVAMATTFLLGNPVSISAKPDNDQETIMLQMLQKVWQDNKLDYEDQALAEAVFSETEAAELWYTEKVDSSYYANTPMQGQAQVRLRYMLLTRSKRDRLYPVFDYKGDMIAFARAYSLKVNGQTVEHFDIYTDKTNYLSYRSTGPDSASGWQVTTEANLIGKIPVVYYFKPTTEWHDVQHIIERYEKSISNHADNNDYFGSPMIVVKGEIKGFAKKGEAGKVLELDNGAEASYLESNTAPASIELEQDNLKSLMHDMSDTPPISFEQISGIGQLSGIALKLLFLGAHMKASKNETIIGKGFQRRLNLLKAALTKINLKLQPASALMVKPVFDYYLPKDDQAFIGMLNTATGGQPTLSQKTAVSLSPLVADPDAELADIKKDGLNNVMNSFFNLPPGPLPTPAPKPAPAPAPVN